MSKLINPYKKGRTLVKDMPVQLAGVIRESIVDGEGVRFVIFAQGCNHGCEGCHNPETHDPKGGFLTNTTNVWKEIRKNPLLEGITFSGGEPFLQPAPFAEIGRVAQEAGLNVMTYTGYLYSDLIEMAKTDIDVHHLLCVTNVLVEGEFILAKRDVGLRYRGSSNQNILDITCYPNRKTSTNINYEK